MLCAMAERLIVNGTNNKSKKRRKYEIRTKMRTPHRIPQNAVKVAASVRGNCVILLQRMEDC